LQLPVRRKSVSLISLDGAYNAILLLYLEAYPKKTQMVVTLARAAVQMAKAKVRIEKPSQELVSIRLETVDLYNNWPLATSRRRPAMPAKVKSHQSCSLPSKARTKAKSQAYPGRFREQNAVGVPYRRVVL
jgi:hypothetical protein